MHPLRRPDDPHVGSGQRVKYFRCGSCHRWVSSTYTEVFRADAKMRTHPVKDSTEADQRFIDVKDRLERWLARDRGPGPLPRAGRLAAGLAGGVRARYHELAHGAPPGPRRLRGEDARAERGLRAHPPSPRAPAHRGGLGRRRRRRTVASLPARSR